MDKNVKEKKKGTSKKLDNYRGIFIVPILSIIFEKLLKNRLSNTLQENISKFQNGGMKGKGVLDNLFIIRGIIIPLAEILECHWSITA